MKRVIMGFLAWTLMALVAGGVDAGVAHGERGSRLVMIGHDALVEEGQTVSEVVVIGGSAKIRGKVAGRVVVIGGMADIDGAVGDEVVVLGSAKIGPKAVLASRLVVIGSAFEADPLSSIRGEKTIISLQRMKSPLGRFGEWVMSGPFKGRPVAPGVLWSWLLVLSFGLLYVLTAAGAPAAVEACAKAIQERPMSVLLAGILGFSGLAPFAFFLVATVAGIAVIPFLAVAVFAAAVVGKAGVCRFMGNKAQVQNPILATTAGAAALAALYAVPLIGLASWMLSTLFGFGAALLAGVEALKGETASAEESVAAPALAEVAPALEAAALPYAGFWLRMAAIVIDAFAWLVIGGMTNLIALGLGGWALYQIGMWTWKGTTLGGMIVGIKGVRLDGRSMDFTVALVRHLASYLSILPMFLGFFWAGWDPEKQAWHDKIAGTIVVRLPSQGGAPPARS
ncbi:MAG: RDD family protein [Elusimicrobia bacterium]|nr:RDD family protein [Elusimicrobiota bacterium]